METVNGYRARAPSRGHKLMNRFILIIGTLAVACMFFVGIVPAPASAKSLWASAFRRLWAAGNSRLLTAGRAGTRLYLATWLLGIGSGDGYYWVPGTWVKPHRSACIGRPDTGPSTTAYMLGILDIGVRVSASMVALTMATDTTATDTWWRWSGTTSIQPLGHQRKKRGAGAQQRVLQSQRPPQLE